MTIFPSAEEIYRELSSTHLAGIPQKIDFMSKDHLMLERSFR